MIQCTLAPSFGLPVRDDEDMATCWLSSVGVSMSGALAGDR